MRTKEHDGFTKIHRIQPNEFSITVPGFETIVWEPKEVTQKMVQDFIDRIPAHNKYPVMIMSIDLYRHIMEKFSAGFIYANYGATDIEKSSFRIGEKKRVAFGFFEKPRVNFLLVVMF
jgi:hypothetical protein